MTLSRKQIFTLSAILFLTALFGSTVTVYAEGAVTNAQCAATRCGTKANPTPCPAYKFMDTTNSFTTQCTCVTSSPGLCKAIGTSGPNGFGLDQVQKILGDLMNKLMQQGQGQGTPPATPPTSGVAGCYGATYTVTQPSSDPCAIYNPSLSDTILNSTTTMSETGTSVSDLLNQMSNTNTNTNTTQSSASDLLSAAAGATTTAAATATRATTSVFTTGPALIPGLRGDIQVLTSGGTVIAGSRNTAANTEVAGFYGGTTFSGQSQGVVASICRSRPWSGNFLSYVLPANFFDGLCIARGYQVGAAQQVAPTVTVSQTQPRPISQPTSTATATTSTPSVPTVEPKVRIWSVPTKVPLGSRASVFWTSQGVSSCSVTSSDGNFSHNTLSGGASTVALTGNTTFTISCAVPGGSTVTESVTVNLAI